MKSYGKPDASWDEAKFRAVIKDMLEMARESKKSCAVGQDRHGNVVVMMAEGKDDSCTYLCWTCAHRNKESHEDELELVDNVEYHHYSVEEMVSKVRDALTKRIVEYGGLRFLSEGRFQIGEAGRMREHVGQDAPRAVHRGPDRCGHNGGANVRKGALRGAGGVRGGRTLVLEPGRQDSGRRGVS